MEKNELVELLKALHTIHNNGYGVTYPKPKDKIVDTLIDKFIERSNKGIQKYGTTLQDNNKDNFLIHLQEELMDAVLYIEKLLSITQKLPGYIKQYPSTDQYNIAGKNQVTI